MRFKYFLNFHAILILLFLSPINLIGQPPNKGILNGIIKIDTTWAPKVYLSYLPTFSEIYSMSSDMIIAESKIDNFGHFEFKLNFLPQEDKLYRLHISKKSDSKTSLIIGGVNENYLLLIANKNSKITLTAKSFNPPFKDVIFNTSKSNSSFQKITNLVYKKDSIASKSGAYKRKFIEDGLNEELLNIADSSTNSLLSLYAIYKTDFQSNYIYNKKFYKSYLKKSSNFDNSYFIDFRKKIPLKESKNNSVNNILLYIILIIIGFIIGKYGSQKNKRIKKLSVQERKIFDLLKNGATNKEISEEFNIGISTAKTHVSSILTKLNIKSRKEIMDLK
tara:strand:+ start:80103 stop:81104 length:1002 start_codon:yes stop_codon:yes gene_type:complete